MLLKILSVAFLIGCFSTSLHPTISTPSHENGSHHAQDENSSHVDVESLLVQCMKIDNENDKYDCIQELNEEVYKQTMRALRESGMSVDSITTKVDKLE